MFLKRMRLWAVDVWPSRPSLGHQIELTTKYDIWATTKDAAEQLARENAAEGEWISVHRIVLNTWPSQDDAIRSRHYVMRGGPDAEQC